MGEGVMARRAVGCLVWGFGDKFILCAPKVSDLSVREFGGRGIGCLVRGLKTSLDLWAVVGFCLCFSGG